MGPCALCPGRSGRRCSKFIRSAGLSTTSLMGTRTNPEIRLEKLHRWHSHIDALYAGKPTSNLRQLADAVSTFDLRREDFLAASKG